MARDHLFSMPTVPSEGHSNAGQFQDTADKYGYSGRGIGSFGPVTNPASFLVKAFCVCNAVHAVRYAASYGAAEPESQRHK
ncbi:unnamed protein product, partial [Iphiclides podalirius]